MHIRSMCEWVGGGAPDGLGVVKYPPPLNTGIANPRLNAHTTHTTLSQKKSSATQMES